MAGCPELAEYQGQPVGDRRADLLVDGIDLVVADWLAVSRGRGCCWAGGGSHRWLEVAAAGKALGHGGEVLVLADLEDQGHADLRVELDVAVEEPVAWGRWISGVFFFFSLRSLRGCG